MDPNTQAPDMQSATGVPAPPEGMSQGGLIDALRSRGTLPANLAQTMQPVGGGSNTGLAVGSGMLNALSGGNAAMNPYLQQQQEQQNKQFWQQRELARMQTQEQSRRAKQDEAAYTISKDLMRSESPDARKAGAQGVVRYLGTLGIPKEQMPTGIVEGLASRRMTDADVNSMLRDIHMGMDDQALAVKYQNASPADIQQARTAKDSPVALKALGLKTPEEQLKTTYDLRIAAANALKAEHPELAGDANTVGAIQMKARELFQKDYAELSSVEQQRAYAAAIADKQAREDDLLRRKGEMDLSKLLMGLQFKVNNPTAAKPLPPQTKLKILEPFTKIQGVTQGVAMVEDAIDELDKIGALPKGNDVASQYSAKLYRSTVLKNHPAVVKFEQLWGPVSIGQIDRGMFDEKGVRAVQAFQKQLNAVDNMPPAQAMKEYLATVRRELERKMGDDVTNLEGIDNMPPDVLQQATRMYTNTFGKGKNASPLNPEKDPLGILGKR